MKACVVGEEEQKEEQKEEQRGESRERSTKYGAVEGVKHRHEPESAVEQPRQPTRKETR